MRCDQVFDAALGAFSGKHGLEQRAHLLAVPGGHALAQQRADHLLGGKAQQFLRSRAHERVAAFAIQGHDQVGEAFHQAARKLLLAMQALLHGATLGDIDERSLVAADAAARIANQSGGVQASDRGAVAAAQSDFMAADRAGQGEFALLGFPLLGLDHEVRERMIEEVFAALVAEDPRERGIYAFEVPVGRRQVDAFLQRLEQLGEASLIFPFLRNVVRQDADSLIPAVANQGVQVALQESRGGIALELHAQHSGPVAPLQKAGQSLFGGGAASVHQVQEFIEGAADEIGKGLSDQIGEAAIGGYDASIEGDGEEQIIEGVDQVAIAALRPLD